MFDCANVEMREMLPELVAGRLDASSRARVEAHVRNCAECASELETLRLVRASFATVPAIDTARIVASLPKPPAATPAPISRAARATRWIDWRVAAALTMITVGGLSVAVTQRLQTGRTVDTAVDMTVDTTTESQRDSALEITRGAVGKGMRDTGESASRASTTLATPRTEKVQLAFGGGAESDLDDDALRALLGALDEIDRTPVAPSAEPDPSPILPVIREGGR